MIILNLKKFRLIYGLLKTNQSQNRIFGIKLKINIEHLDIYELNCFYFIIYITNAELQI